MAQITLNITDDAVLAPAANMADSIADATGKPFTVEDLFRAYLCDAIRDTEFMAKLWVTAETIKDESLEALAANDDNVVEQAEVEIA